LFVQAKRRTKPKREGGAFLQLKEGFSYAFGYPPIRDLIIFVALIGLFALPFSILLPAFAKNVFNGTAMILGLLTGGFGAGSLIGALFLTSGRLSQKQLGQSIIFGCALFGFALVVFGFSQFLPLSLLAVALVGFGSMILLAGSNTVIQTIVDEDKRGRVASLVVMAFMGLSPFGCIAAGAVANTIGCGSTVVVIGVLTLALAAFFWSRVLRIHLTVSAVEVERTVDEADTEISAMNS
jgi:MFS family permease